MNIDINIELSKEKAHTNAVVKVLAPNLSGGDGRSTRAAPSRTFLSDPPLLPKPKKGTTGTPVWYIS